MKVGEDACPSHGKPNYGMGTSVPKAVLKNPGIMFSLITSSSPLCCSGPQGWLGFIANENCFFSS